MFMFCLTAWFMLSVICYERGGGASRALTKSYILYTAFQALSLEVLSVFNAIGFWQLSCLWIVFTAALLAVSYKRTKLKAARSFAKALLHNINKLHPIYYSVYAILFIIGLIFPPNNYDSMTYHLPRIMHWLQNGNLDFYQTNNIRQLSTPPLCEYKILHSMALMKSDIFATSVQYTAMLILIPAVYSIVCCFLEGEQKKDRALRVTVVLIPSVAMILFQATTTQTDLVSSALAVCLLYCLIQPLARGKLCVEDMIFMCLTASLAYFAKPTSLVFIFFAAAVCGVAYLKRFGIKTLLIFPLCAACALLVMGPFFARMYGVFHSFTGSIGKNNLNPSLSFPNMISNVIKNFSMHLCFSNPYLRESVEWAVHRLHRRTLHIPLNAYSPYGKYMLLYHESEDIIGNVFYLFVLILSLLILAAYRKRCTCRKTVLVYLASLFLGYCLFSLIAPWQPWQTRLDLPWFALTLPVAVYAFANCDMDFKVKMFGEMCKVPSLALVVLVYLSAAPHLIYNGGKNPHKLIKIMRKGRVAAFNSDGYIEAASIIKKNGWKKAGLCMGVDSWEYPMWVFTDALNKGITMQYLGTSYANKGFASVKDADVWIGHHQPEGTHIAAKFDGITMYLPDGK